MHLWFNQKEFLLFTFIFCFVKIIFIHGFTLDGCKLEEWMFSMPTHALAFYHHVFHWCEAVPIKPFSNFSDVVLCIQWTIPQLSLMIIYNSTWSILGLYCQLTIWPRKHKRKTPSQDQRKSTAMGGAWNSVEGCIKDWLLFFWCK